MDDKERMIKRGREIVKKIIEKCKKQNESPLSMFKKLVEGGAQYDDLQWGYQKPEERACLPEGNIKTLTLNNPDDEIAAVEDENHNIWMQRRGEDTWVLVGRTEP